MSEAINMPNARQAVEAAYDKMCEAYANWQYLGRDPLFSDNYRVYYEGKHKEYLELCTFVVELLLRTNPAALEDIKIW